uniref:Anthranilate synthase component 2 n=1 Tax=Kumanoa americana TaxID=1196377 RepID=A0A1C9CGP2_9FLOR|nr:anthranilate synthase component 2 [Kumanoa americana]AOM67563.1 anthranilate synthase component 2 [Kumanoa americana]
MILIIDNYDSFTYNLVQYVGSLNFSVKVIRNDNITYNKIQQLSPSHIIISPGPGSPCDSGISLSVIRHVSNSIPILGVCLGHQSIGLVYGANITHAPSPMHGKTSAVHHTKRGIFSGIPSPFDAARYHSLIIESDKLPQYLEITAWTEDGVIMACQHKFYPHVYGIQFHPESLWTAYGKKLLNNFLHIQDN